jgi:NADH-quinone oxidoreductase subunit H
VVNLNIGVFFFLAISSLETIAIVMGGWASRSKFSLLGAMRAVAQVVSYEVPLALSVISVVMMVGSLSTQDIASAQSGFYGLNWFVFRPWGLLGFILFLITGVAEVNRTPFDTPEGESELVAGFHTEYSGMKFALFQMAEFLSAFAVSAMATTLFLGAWNGPLLPSWLWFMLKAMTLVFFMMWLRGTFPRFRIDQVMAFSWKFLLPLSMVNIFVTALDYFVPGIFGSAIAWLLMVISFLTIWAVNSREGAQPYGAITFPT